MAAFDAMSAQQQLQLTFRAPSEHDHPRVVEALTNWWRDQDAASAGRRRLALVHRMFFQHFTTTSQLVERGPDLVGFLVGFLSPDRPQEAYIHVVATDPHLRRHGLGAELYRRFFGIALGHGRSAIRAVTSPENRTSIAFHQSVGFDLEPGPSHDGLPLQIDYAGPGQHRVALVVQLAT